MLTMLWGRRAVKYVIANAEDVRKKQGSGARVALPGYLERSDYFSEILVFFEHESLVSPPCSGYSGEMRSGALLP